MHRDAIIRLCIIRKMIVRGYTRHHGGDAKQISYSFTCDTSAKIPVHITHTTRGKKYIHTAAHTLHTRAREIYIHIQI